MLQKSTWQHKQKHCKYGMNVFVIKIKVLKQHGINVEANKEFCDGCALGKAHRQSFRTQTS